MSFFYNCLKNIYKYTATDADTVGETSGMTWSIECDTAQDACDEGNFPFSIDPEDGQLRVKDPDNNVIVETLNQTYFAIISVSFNCLWFEASF